MLALHISCEQSSRIRRLANERSACLESCDIHRSVEKFAKDFKAKHKKLDALVNNAGVFLPPHEKTPAGLEVCDGIVELR